MFITIKELLITTFYLLNEMSPYLLLGFFIAGIIKIYIPSSFISKHLQPNNIKSIIKATIIGIPLPICSCGVIPLSLHLKKNNVNKGALMSFLTSTPTTGIDSLLPTYSLLGGLFTIFRILSAFFIGFISGLIVNLMYKSSKKEKNYSISNEDSTDLQKHEDKKTFLFKIKAIFKYSFVTLIKDIQNYLIIGIIIGGLISYFLPPSLIENYLSNNVYEYLLMIVLGFPTYVCSTGSIPIAASLIAKGISPGAGLVFLIVGPASNTATISFIIGSLGKKTCFIYISTIILGASLWGILLDQISINYPSNIIPFAAHKGPSINYTFQTICSIILISLFIFNYLHNKIIRLRSH